jgi:hypothetical protein
LSELIQREEKIDWNEVVQLAKRTHSLKPLALGLNLAVKLSDAEIHFSLPEMEAMRPVADQMLATIFTDHKPEYSSLRAIGKNFQIIDHLSPAPFAARLRLLAAAPAVSWREFATCNNAGERPANRGLA